MHELKIITKIAVYRDSELTETEKKLISVAKESVARAYAPYSGFGVGVALLLDNGEMISGNNQENGAYPSGLCAERVAVFYANSRYPEAKILTVAVVAATGGRFVERPVTPCGSCRQVLIESERRQHAPIRLLMCGEAEIQVVDEVSSLLPLAFEL